MAVLRGSNYYSSVFNNIGEAYLNLDLAKGLRFRSSIGSNIAFNTSDQFQATFASSAGVSSGSEAKSQGMSMLNENVLSYSVVLNKDHEINALAGASYQKYNSRSSQITAVSGSFNNDIIHSLNNAIINPALTSTSQSQWGLISYFSRVNYGFRNKYLIAASIRTDGSSRFGPDNRWAYFPSASVAWRVSQEKFLENVKAISELKIRASYGATGNFNIGDFDYLGKIGDVYYAPGDVLTKGQAQSSFGNNKLSWEKTNGYDVGLDLGLFHNRLNITLDYYDKRTSKLLYNVSIPSITGFPTSISNIGQISNKGFELEVSGKILTGALTWDASFNAAKNINRVEDLGGVEERFTTDTYGMSWILRKGQPMFSYYGYKTIGVLKTQEEVNSSPVLAGSKVGNPKFQDTNNDGKITAADKVILGNFQSKAFFGFINNFSYRAFDLSIAMQASVGAKMYNFENEYYQGALLGAMRRSLVETQWWSESEPGDDKMPASALSTLSFQTSSDVYIENASFLAVRNVNLGYTLPSSFAGKIKLSNFRVYASLANPVMITSKNFHGYNPEGYTAGEISGINSKPGYNNGSEPISRVFTIGINAGF
jgi:TonB-dependent starch-binding outer membrane protein SusC